MSRRPEKPLLDDKDKEPILVPMVSKKLQQAPRVQTPVGGKTKKQGPNKPKPTPPTKPHRNASKTKKPVTGKGKKKHTTKIPKVPLCEASSAYTEQTAPRDTSGPAPSTAFPDRHVMREPCLPPSNGNRGETRPLYATASDTTDFTQTRNYTINPHTALFFDWDDTILPTSWLEASGLINCKRRPLTEEENKQLLRISSAAVSVLEQALEVGEVAIITNASMRFFQESSKRFLPQVAQLVKDRNIRVVSARDTYQSISADGHVWKAHAFKKELDRLSSIAQELYRQQALRKNRQYQQGGGKERISMKVEDSPPCVGMREAKNDKDILLNLVSFGDGAPERRGFLCAAREAERVCPLYWKALKFILKPDPQQICRQLEFLSASLSDVVGHQGSIDVMFGARL
uniref:Uncharacterized protein n=1 Tax=Chromera velia CCMP2878 TaxID=1169474 RepID=A0A0G4FET9_9ALVE|eukprot:Cvel_16565.t1-p1 / transcript=Cvel_16565.t1 / gene=Cvel_16565 / organism=Chromera_velia_CCMP2878 / gene_product=hypothetical protein / transcript_product=hypothetical protein / location=Cvel_scaffold1281:28958-31249(+) / protein_length=400 / sequence_SO=supercontig / SO=protein_coding / is_pseudo=false